MSIKHVLARAGVLSATVSITGLVAVGTASAHVTAEVYGEQPEQGGYTAITFRVPNEEPDVGTTELSVSIPEEYGLGSARTKPVPGWTAEVVTSEPSESVTNGHGAELDEVVTEIVWEAEPGNEIPAGTSDYQEFSFSTGPLPSDVDTLVLPAAQTYEDGTVSDWDAPPPEEGEDEPDHPAPVIDLAEPNGDGHGDGSETTTAETTGDAAEASDQTARWLGGGGLALGALGIGIGIGATVNSRRQSGTSTVQSRQNQE